MKKVLSIMAIIIIAIPFFSTACVAANEYSYIDTENVEKSLSEAAKEDLKGIDIGENTDFDGVLERILDRAASNVASVLKNASVGAMSVLAVSMLCSIAEDICPPKSKLSEVVMLCSIAAVAAVTVSGLNSMVSEATETVNELSTFSKVLLPVLASASAASGAVTAAAAKYAASMLFIDVLVTVGEKLVLPMIYLYLAVSIASAAFNCGLSGVSKLIAKAIKIMLTVLSTSFTLYLMATGLIKSSADAAAVKVTKSVISTTLPVIGSVISDAADAVASGAKLLRSAIGVFGMLAVISTCILPLLRLGISSMMYHVSAALSSTVADKRVSGLIDDVATAYSMVLALVGTMGIMLFISLISMTGAIGGL